MFSQNEIIQQAAGMGAFSGFQGEYDDLNLDFFVEFVEANAYDHDDHRHLVRQDGMELVYENCRTHGCESRWQAATMARLASRCLATYEAAKAERWAEHAARVAVQNGVLR